MQAAPLATVCAALSDVTRIEVLRLCTGRVCVRQIASTLGVTSSTASYHLSILEEVGLVEVVRHGRRHLPRKRPQRLAVMLREVGWLSR